LPSWSWPFSPVPDGITRQQAADAAAQIKAGSKVAAVEIKKEAVEAGKQGKAIAEGVKEGWTAQSKKVNINTASKDLLLTLPGMDDDSAARIVAGRPYHSKDELKTKGIVSPEEYQKIQDKISINSKLSTTQFSKGQAKLNERAWPLIFSMRAQPAYLVGSIFKASLNKLK
jgi:hypothetical protein